MLNTLIQVKAILNGVMEWSDSANLTVIVTAMNFMDIYS
jgi:hypothetical protein